MIRVFLPEGPGARLLLARLRQDWGAIGLTVEPAASASAADLKLVDEVAPSTAPAWFLRRFACGSAAICDDDIDALLEGAEVNPIVAQRSALLARRLAPDRRAAAVHPPRRADPLVAGVQPRQRLCREPLCHSHAHRTGTEIVALRMMNNPDDPARGFAGLATDPGSVRRRVEGLERVMERLVVVPGINRPMGLDVILDFVPFAGPTAAAAIGAYLAWEARNLGMSKGQMARMGGNIGVDWMLGMIPWIGAIPDFFFRSNTRNLRIIKRHLDKHHPSSATIDAQALPPSINRR